MYKERLKFIREENDVKQKELANLLEMHRGSYSKYEIEDAIMPLKHLNTLCNYFNVSIDYIFGFIDKLQYKDNKNKINSKILITRLKEFRKAKKITQKELADILNTNQSVIANYERGRTIIATPFLYDICKKYNISADYLLGKIDEPKYLK